MFYKGKVDGIPITQYTDQEMKDMGFGICEKCGAIMEDTSDPLGNDIFRCSVCGWEVLQDEYFGIIDEDEEEDYPEFDTFYVDDDDDIPDEGCRACGGPYPDCKTSCPLFDD